MGYPQTREVRIRLLAEGRWISGSLTVPRLQGLLSFLNRDEPFLKLKDVRLEASGERMDFLSIVEQRVGFVVPEGVTDQQVREFVGETDAHDVVALVRGATVRGQAELPARVRLSDYLARNAGFLPLRHCLVTQRGDVRSVPLVLLNRRSVIGVSELTDASAVGA